MKNCILVLIGIGIVWISVVLLGATFDKHCIKGRLSEAQSVVINKTKWNKCIGDCNVKEKDRVLRRECSELSRAIFLMG